jgi:hypothetical protein
MTMNSVAYPVESGIAGTATEKATVTGEVLDLFCYYQDGGSGPGHATWARACISHGLPVALKTKDGSSANPCTGLERALMYLYKYLIIRNLRIRFFSVAALVAYSPSARIAASSHTFRVFGH